MRSRKIICELRRSTNTHALINKKVSDKKHFSKKIKEDYYKQKLINTIKYTKFLITCVKTFHPQKILHTKILTDIFLYTTCFSVQKLLYPHTETFACGHFCTQKLFNTGAFLHKRFCTETTLHTNKYIQTLAPIIIFTRNFL